MGEIESEEVEPFMTDNKASNMFKAKGLEKDVDVVMKKARQSVMNPKTQPRVSNIPASFSGTWSGANQSEPIAPRSTVLKKMHEAGGLNKKIWSIRARLSSYLSQCRQYLQSIIPKKKQTTFD